MADAEVPVADEEAWLYETKDNEAPPDIVDLAANAEDSQEEPVIVEESNAEDKPDADKSAQEDGEEDDDDEDDEDDVEITIGDPKTATAPALNTNTTFSATPVNLNIKKTLATTTAVTSAPGGQLIKPPQKGLDVEAVANINGTNIYEFNIDTLEEKPWRKPGADITDYFNYGFTEDSWKSYCDRHRRTRDDNNSQNMKGSINHIQSSGPPMGGNYEKPYRPSYPPREPKEFRKTGTIDVIGGSNSRRPAVVEEMLPPMMPPMNDMPYPPGMPPPNYDPHIPPPHQGMPPHAMSMPPPPFDPRFPPPNLEMVPPPFAQGPPPHDPYGSAGPPQAPPQMMDVYHRPDERPMEDLDYDRRRHHRFDDINRSRDDRDDSRDGRRHGRDRNERDERRDREDRDRRDRSDRERDRDKDRDSERHRSNRKSRRHDDDDDDRRSSSKHKRSKRDDDP